MPGVVAVIIVDVTAATVERSVGLGVRSVSASALGVWCAACAAMNGEGDGSDGDDTAGERGTPGISDGLAVDGGGDSGG